MTVKEYAGKLWHDYKAPVLLTGAAGLAYAAGAATERMFGLPPGQFFGEYGRLAPHFFLSLAGAETARRWAGESWESLPWYKKAGVLASGAFLPLVAYEAYEGLGSAETGYNILKGIVDEAPVIGDLPRQGFAHGGDLYDVAKPAAAALIAEGAAALRKEALRSI